MTGRSDVLATRDLRYRQADGREETVTVTLFPPTQRIGMEWSCSFEIRTPRERIDRSIHGIDALQALVLTLHILPLELRSIPELEEGEFIDAADLGLDMACLTHLGGVSAVADAVVRDNVRHLQGPLVDDAWHLLIEAGQAVAPAVVDALMSTPVPRVRVKLIQALAEFRLRDTSAVLAAMLHDPDPDVWKAALDALVTVGGASARFVLERELASCSAQQRPWIEEAISQLRADQH